MSINQVIKTKLLIFEYYNEFYKSVYEEEDYSKIRLQVYSFLLSTAKDNVVPPAPLAGSRKPGKERISTLNRQAVSGDGVVMEFYRNRKMLIRKDLLRIRNLRTDELQDFELLPAAEPIIKDLKLAQEDFNKHRFQNLTPEELQNYRELEQKIKCGMLKILK